jgi:hypothetical protein
MYTKIFIGYTPTIVYTTSTINITITDGSSGLLYFITFSNECTRATGNFACEATTGREQVVDSIYEIQMTDNGDGTYSATTTISRPGDITYYIRKYTQGGVYNEYFSTTNWSGTNGYINITSTLDHYWGGAIYGGVYSGVYDASGNFYFKLYSPVTGAYTFYLDHDDSAYLWINNNNILSVG